MKGLTWWPASRRDSENLILPQAKLTEACPIAAEPRSRFSLSRRLDYTVCEADRSVGGFLQREGCGFLPDSQSEPFGEALIEDG